MLLSMTGFGEDRHRDERFRVMVEVRTVNNRYLKITSKYPDVYSSFEGEMEKIVREFVSRGTVMIAIRVEREATSRDYQINQVALLSYWDQLQSIASEFSAPKIESLTDLLPLPGIVTEESASNVDAQQEWQIISAMLRGALKKLTDFRTEEGQSMHRELVDNCAAITEQLEQVGDSAPKVVTGYRDKILQRVRQLLDETEATVEDTDLIRETSIFADRCDINEEIVRLRCHLEQFATFMNSDVSAGRKLEFLCQEMFREVNTIGSKANDVTIAHCVVEMKAEIEKMREILQNVE